MAKELDALVEAFRERPLTRAPIAIYGSMPSPRRCERAAGW